MPENQNMQKTSDNEAMLQEIVQNTEMGKNTLDELMGLTYDQKLKDEMMRQKNEYRRLNQQAHTALDAIGAQAKGQSAAATDGSRHCWPGHALGESTGIHQKLQADLLAQRFNDGADQ